MLHFCSKAPSGSCFTQCQCFIFSSPFPRAFAHAIPLTCKAFPVDGQGSRSALTWLHQRGFHQQWPAPVLLCSFLENGLSHIPYNLLNPLYFLLSILLFLLWSVCPTWMKIPCGQEFVCFMHGHIPHGHNFIPGTNNCLMNEKQNLYLFNKCFYFSAPMKEYMCAESLQSYSTLGNPMDWL